MYLRASRSVTKLTPAQGTNYRTEYQYKKNGSLSKVVARASVLAYGRPAGGACRHWQSYSGGAWNNDNRLSYQHDGSGGGTESG